MLARCVKVAHVAKIPLPPPPPPRPFPDCMTVDGCQRFRPFSDLTPRGFGPFPFRPWRFRPPDIKKSDFCQSLFTYSFYPKTCFPIISDRSPELCTAIKQGRRLLHEPSLTFNFLFLLHWSLNLQVRSFPAFRVIPNLIIHQIWSFSFTYHFCFLSVVLITCPFFITGSKS